MAAITIDLASPVPAYRQIASALRALLVAGELAPGTSLPTVRDLAVDLGVHHNTVAEAYRGLAEEGWLELRRKVGARVLDRPRPRRPRRGERETFGRRLRELVAEARAAGLSEADLRREVEGLTIEAGRSR
jgi:DNA-binding transcriptional regulator YhcF (GntR family)